ncbi:MAG: alcohol dehydrogenase [Acidimicrobiaceae bacterium]|nr:alcohol dehydrogenase [Acidimicrobiaceae bacterium]
MKAVVVTAPGRWSLEEVPDPSPGPLEVVVEVERCGVCGTDLHVLDGEHSSVRYPVIPGHELSGRVVALGEGVSGPALGTLVAVDPMVFCGHCRQCRSGWTNLCANGGGLGTTADGAFARYVRVAASQCEPVPDAVPARWASVTEPLSCVLHALDRIGPVVGANALVLGAGPAGLLLTRLLSLGGARVDVVERRPARRDVAPTFGAERTAEQALDLDVGDGWQVVVDATGNAAAIEEGLGLVRRAGTFAVFGVSSADAKVTLSPYDVFARELTIVGSNSVRHSFGRALELLASRQIPIDALLDEPVPLTDIETAFRHTREGSGLKATVLSGAS